MKSHNVKLGARNRKKVQAKPPLLAYVANAEDEVTSQSYTVIEYRKPLKRIGTVYIPRDKADNAKEVVGILLSRNADIPYQDPDAIRAVEAALRGQPREQWLFASHLGWRGNLYVLPDRVIGPERTLKIRPPQWVEDRQRAMLGRSGDLLSWKNNVAEMCRNSSRLMVLMSAAFAAPILKLIGRPSFWLHLHGPGKSGKTLSSLVIGSVIGIGTDQQLPTWNTTNAAFQETARLFNDSVLIIDELALLGPAGKDAYQRVKALTYMFGAGVETSRSRQSAFAVPPASAAWRSILVSTGEHSIAALAAQSGQKRDAGELARAHDLPALVAGKKTIFDMRPAAVPKKKASSWARAQLNTLRRTIASHHGHALDPLIREIREMGDELRPYVEKCTKRFQNALAAPPKDGALQHAADNFGIIYAGGCLAIKADIVPWTEEQICAATVKCFNAFISEVGEQQGLAERARKIVLERLASTDLPLKEGDFKTLPPDGFRKKTPEGAIFAISTKTFESWFPQGERKALMREALCWLDGAGKLIKTEASVGGLQTGRRWAVTWVKWHGDKGMRVIQFRDPQ
jgi:putative DNA primase/helicase